MEEQSLQTESGAKAPKFKKGVRVHKPPGGRKKDMAPFKIL